MSKKAVNTIIAVIVVAISFAAGFALRGTKESKPVVAANTTEQKQLWTCSMHPQVIQDHPGRCPICHMELVPLKTDSQSPTTSSERQIKYWWDPMMNPPYISDRPGKSPMGMDLVPVYEDEIRGGLSVKIDPVVVQNMGVRTAPAVLSSLQQEIRVVGYLQEPEPQHRDINLRVNGWIEKLYANIDGMPITKGQPLFDLYSPDMQVAISEMIAARKSLDAATDEVERRTAETLAQSSARKLELWGLEPKQVTDLSKLDKAPETVTFIAPIGGHLTEKRVYDGAGVMSGTLVMRLADRSRMWVDAQVFEQQLSLVTMGAKARVTIVSEPGKQFEGEVIFIHPHVDPMTRTARVRIEIPNQDYQLRQGMYATVDLLTTPSPPVLVIPREAVIDTGRRQLAFVSVGDGQFEPREVTLGLNGRQGMVQVLKGIAPNEQVVTSGQFLLDSESRLKEAIQKHLKAQLVSYQPPPDAHVEHDEGAPTTEPTTAPTTGQFPGIDELSVAYLELAQTLGARQQTNDPLGMDRLINIAQTSAQHSSPESAPLVDAVLRSAEAMKDKPLAEQRRGFVELSKAMIALVDYSPPTKAVSDQLFVMECPMAFDVHGAYWLQTTDKIANPFYATQMKNCGEINRTITTVQE